MFKDRQDAGRKLAKALGEYKNKDVVVLAIPRGGVIVAREVADYLKCPLDLIILRKIGAPGNSELAVGAVAGPNQVVLNHEIIQMFSVSLDYVQKKVDEEIEEIKRRKQKYTEGRQAPVDNKTVIIVDDGIATGSTALAAIQAVKADNPKEVILAAPVASPSTIKRLKSELDNIVVLEAPDEFYAVGQFYEVFEQTTDEEVIEAVNSD